ncbi:hypothetical protein N7519_001134 [Penicillium mononematosum]|uniref:uncharacterized protein n=1 Tax=Penicillium mononematosum TaxID=268346 RepID=UPI0025482CDD|nr:uncharacterized protein N7519_001134 [Penicillium mononematosum]KAJ6191113.1 hypothetical protein N7519_001134 [Penicillium mononematosum]
MSTFAINYRRRQERDGVVSANGHIRKASEMSQAQPDKHSRTARGHHVCNPQRHRLSQDDFILSDSGN